MTPKTPPALHVHLWIERGGLSIGRGRIELLRRTDEMGSLRKASESLGMSYRAAWGKIRNAEERMGITLVEKIKGEGQRFQLTAEARELVKSYTALLDEVKHFALRRGRDLFGVDMTLHVKEKKS